MTGGDAGTAVAAPAVWAVGAHSERGARRGSNMDAVALAADAGLVVLADGMGSTERGGEAAALAVESFLAALTDQGGPAEPDGARTEDDVQRAVATAQERVVERFGTPVLTGATTLCALVTGADDLLVVSVGDSRAQLLRDGELTVLTTDHTVAAHLVAVGAAEPDSPLVRRTANHLRRYLGNPAGEQADIIPVRSEPGDVVLLSTDGVHGALTAAQLTDILLGTADPGVAARRLVVAAAAAGGTDDATAIVVRLPA